jgi:hypothetical protein
MQRAHGREFIRAVGGLDAQDSGLFGECRERLARAEAGVQRRRGAAVGRVARQNLALRIGQHHFVGMQFRARGQNVAQQFVGRLVGRRGKRLIDAHRQNGGAQLDFARRILDRAMTFRAQMTDRRDRQQRQE